MSSGAALARRPCEPEEGRQAHLGASRPTEPKEGPVAPMDCSKSRGPWVGIRHCGQPAGTRLPRRRAAAQGRCSSHASPCPCSCRRRPCCCCRSRVTCGLCAPPEVAVAARARHPPGLVQPDPAVARRAVLVTVFSSLARQSSLSGSMSWALANVGSTSELAMSSAVLEKRGLRPRRRARMSYESSTGWPTSRRAAALVFSR